MTLWDVSTITVFSPAKINLFLAITGRRSDGFHELVSVVAPVEFGDELQVELTASGGFSLRCDQEGVPVDETNLVLRAAKAFQEATGWRGGARFTLEKRIPVGAGLGGGSSNAVAALRALNTAAGGLLTEAALEEIAARLGSDCVLFLRDAPVVMRGRGERVELLSETTAKRLRGRRVLLFKPGFGISTAWAYGRMIAKAPESYLPAVEAERKLAAWLGAPEVPGESLLFNNMEGPAFEKYLALPTLLKRLRDTFALAVGMSGSGSACVAFLEEKTPVDQMSACIRDAWGSGVFVIETRIR